MKRSDENIFTSAIFLGANACVQVLSALRVPPDWPHVAPQAGERLQSTVHQQYAIDRLLQEAIHVIGLQVDW